MIIIQRFVISPGIFDTLAISIINTEMEIEITNDAGIEHMRLKMTTGSGTDSRSDIHGDESGVLGGNSNDWLVRSLSIWIYVRVMKV